jgi:hypothetical protein
MCCDKQAKKERDRFKSSQRYPNFDRRSGLASVGTLNDFSEYFPEEIATEEQLKDGRQNRNAKIPLQGDKC